MTDPSRFSHTTAQEEKLRTDEQRRLETFQLGVWKVSILKGTRLNFGEKFLNLKEAFGYFKRLAIDVYTLEPMLATLFMLNELWSGVQAALLLYLSSQMLRTIEMGLIQGSSDIGAILKAVAMRIFFCRICSSITMGKGTTSSNTEDTDNDPFRVASNAGSTKDRPSHFTNQVRASSYDAWASFEGIVAFLNNTLRALAQLVLIVQLSLSIMSPPFAVVCIVKPIFLTLTQRSLLNTAHIVHTDNEHRQRMTALNCMSSPGYRSEVLGSDIINYIVDEYRKATRLLGGLSDEWAPLQYMIRTSPTWEITNDILGDLPIIYCAIISILYPQRLSLSSIAILQQSSHSLGSAIQYVVININSFQQQYQQLKNVYDASKMANTLADGDITYSNPSSDAESKGMSFELHDVLFSYPGSQSINPVLSDVNLSIKPGQMVVIVGSNGSGKSTILKLLSRFYDPTSGPESILVDGVPISQYRMKDLRRATATLTQEHSLFPLSLGENIGLGYSENVNDAEMIDRSAEKGGASHCLKRLERGKETKLWTQNGAYGYNLPDDPDHPLQGELEKLQKNIELSGGETQRIVAARTFMRFETGRVRFVAVDEPSSALDSEGELALFNNLLQAREGKTMIFVTHRFGHLTKRADLVVCMKDGTIIEAGTHTELMAREGEYAKLYNIQASAFTDNDSP